MLPARATILIVDDEAQNRRLLQALLQPEGYLSQVAANGADALALVAAAPPDLILLDVMMPGMNGYEVAKILKRDAATCNIPIIMVTAQMDRSARLAGLESGAEDFLTKPIDRAELWLRVRNLLRLKAYGNFLQEHSLILEREVAARTADLRHLVEHDSLTGLPNRLLFNSQLEDCIAKGGVDSGEVAVLMLDLDHFKNVNDRLGHGPGDRLLCQVGQRLCDYLVSARSVARLGGDEFAIALPLREGRREAMVMADQIRAVLRPPFFLEGHEVSITTSIGIALHPVDSTDAQALLQFADTAMYRAKEAGRNKAFSFTAQMSDELYRRIDLEAALHQAVANGEFELYYQPKASLQTGKITGLEALLRWNRPGVGVVSPMEFVGVLEDSGLIVPVGRWVIGVACDQMARWIRSGLGAVQISVNVSGHQFASDTLVEDVATALQASGVPPGMLELELTESTLMAHTEQTVETLYLLKRLGVSLALDDFGTGYSSLAYLRRFPIDKLKVDIEFIRDITTSPDGAALALAIIGMAQSLRMEVVAEGVETEAQLTYLQRNGCEQMQGYYFSPPLPLSGIEEMLRVRQTLPLADLT